MLRAVFGKLLGDLKIKDPAPVIACILFNALMLKALEYANDALELCKCGIVDIALFLFVRQHREHQPLPALFVEHFPEAVGGRPHKHLLPFSNVDVDKRWIEEGSFGTRLLPERSVLPVQGGSNLLRILAAVMIEEDEPSLFRECGCKLAKGFALSGDDEVPAARLGCRQGP